MRLSPVWRKHNRDAILAGVADCCDYVNVRGRQVEVRRLGCGLGQPLVLVPGLAGGSRLLMPLARRLATRQEVILYELAGEVDAYERRPEDRLGSDALDLVELIRHLGLEQPGILGVSYGGAVALEAIVHHPATAGALIVSGAAARFEAGLGANVAMRILERFPLPASNPFVNQFFNLLHGGVPRSERLATFVTEQCWTTDPGVMASRLRALESYDVRGHLWRVDVPTLVVAGGRDVVVPCGEQEELADGIAGARFVRLADAGHVGFLTHGPEMRDLVGELFGARQRAWL
jgi:pimeloyl-ACP methyl ester carboxylesterase